LNRLLLRCCCCFARFLLLLLLARGLNGEQAWSSCATTNHEPLSQFILSTGDFS
jgi:hypothetical protein